jgi:hypothetical protein
VALTYRLTLVLVFLDLPLKNSLRGWHRTWFYCENHEANLPSFVGRLPMFQGT